MGSKKNTISKKENINKCRTGREKSYSNEISPNQHNSSLRRKFPPPASFSPLDEFQWPALFFLLAAVRKSWHTCFSTQLPSWLVHMPYYIFYYIDYIMST